MACDRSRRPVPFHRPPTRTSTSASDKKDPSQCLFEPLSCKPASNDAELSATTPSRSSWSRSRQTVQPGLALVNPEKRLTRVIDHDVALLRSGYWYPVVANRQSTDLKQVIHDGLEVRLTTLHGDHVVAEKCGAVPQTEVMPSSCMSVEACTKSDPTKLSQNPSVTITSPPPLPPPSPVPDTPTGPGVPLIRCPDRCRHRQGFHSRLCLDRRAVYTQCVCEQGIVEDVLEITVESPRTGIGTGPAVAFVDDRC